MLLRNEHATTYANDGQIYYLILYPFVQRVKYTIRNSYIISLFDIQCDVLGLHHSSLSLSSLVEIDYEESLLYLRTR